MDAGVYLPEPAAGVAVGLVTKDDIDLQKKPGDQHQDHGDYLLLADITVCIDTMNKHSKVFSSGDLFSILIASCLSCVFYQTYYA